MDPNCKEGCAELDVATLENTIAELKTQLATANDQVKTLTEKATESTDLMKRATDALNEYAAAEKKALIDSIILRSDFKADELKDMAVVELRTINVAIDKAKPRPAGTVKNVRGAGDGTPTRLNITADGRVDPTKSIMGSPVRQADGSVKWIED
jgi:uncharacterized coiled-coil protein SlyX